MTFEKPAIAVLIPMLAVVAGASVGTARGQAGGTVYVEVECMRSTSDDYVDVETEVWKPIHQEAVKQGKMVRWALYRVLYGDRSECDHYTVNTYRGSEQLNADRAYGDYFATAHPGKSWQEAMQRTTAARAHVRSELWLWIDGIAPGDYPLVEVNQMYAADGPAYVKAERETWKPVHQALVERGHSAGWALYELVSPHGTSIPYNFRTVNHLRRLGPLPFEETLASVHPETGTAELQAAGELRDHLLSEIWTLVASTE